MWRVKIERIAPSDTKFGRWIQVQYTSLKSLKKKNVWHAMMQAILRRMILILARIEQNQEVKMIRERYYPTWKRIQEIYYSIPQPIPSRKRELTEEEKALLPTLIKSYWDATYVTNNVKEFPELFKPFDDANKQGRTLAVDVPTGDLVDWPRPVPVKPKRRYTRRKKVAE